MPVPPATDSTPVFVRVTLPPAPPPLSPAPAVTPVTVPAPGVEQAHVLPFHCNTWRLAQVLVRPTLTLPAVPPPVNPASVVTPVIVPTPGNAWPTANVNRPALFTASPVSAGAPLPGAYSRFSVPDRLAVSFPAGSACQRKCWLMDLLPPLLKDAASRSSGLELAPAAALAAPSAFRVSVLRIVAVPFTSNVAAGVVVPMPTWPPASKIAEGSTVHDPVNWTTSLAVAVPSLVILVQPVSGGTSRAPSGLASEAVTAGAASTNADGGNPPSVSASPACKAYGALTNSARGCSA